MAGPPARHVARYLDRAWWGAGVGGYPVPQGADVATLPFCRRVCHACCRGCAAGGGQRAARAMAHGHGHSAHEARSKPIYGHGLCAGAPSLPSPVPPVVGRQLVGRRVVKSSGCQVVGRQVVGRSRRSSSHRSSSRQSLVESSTVQPSAIRRQSRQPSVMAAPGPTTPLCLRLHLVPGATAWATRRSLGDDGCRRIP